MTKESTLTFGTGGIRGIMGSDPGSMNESMVARVTKGLAEYLKKTGGTSVCIAYDTRNNSKKYAEVAMSVLTDAGIRVYYYSDVRPTPMLSFAIRHNSADAGIVITASHNPPEYNGYKIYGPDGGQITDTISNTISKYINSLESPDTNTVTVKQNLIECIDEIDSIYYEKVIDLSLRKEMLRQNAPYLAILYTPLHGTGSIPVRYVLNNNGFSNLVVMDCMCSHFHYNSANTHRIHFRKNFVQLNRVGCCQFTF